MRVSLFYLERKKMGVKWGLKSINLFQKKSFRIRSTPLNGPTCGKSWLMARQILEPA